MSPDDGHGSLVDAEQGPVGEYVFDLYALREDQDTHSAQDPTPEVQVNLPLWFV